MLKRIFSLILTLVMLLTLAGCGADNSDDLKKIHLCPGLDTQYQPHRIVCSAGKGLV